MHFIVGLLSIAGLSISLYFSLAYFGITGATGSWVPAICRMDEGPCHLVIHHPDARILWVPNSVLGMAYYIAVLLMCAGAGPSMLAGIVLWASWLSVVLGVYLVYSLYVRIRVGCPLCLVSHAVNLGIAVAVTFWW